MAFDRKSLVIPNGCVYNADGFEVEGDVVIGNKCRINCDIKTKARVFIGERTVINGNIHADGEVRVDRWTVINGNITSGGSVYLGDRVRIDGRLEVEGNLDVGSNVDIKEYEARGWINIRHPIPIIIYIIIYLLDLIRQGRGEEIERIIEELEDMGEEIVVSPNFMYFPDRSVLAGDVMAVDGIVRVGEGSSISLGLKTRGSVIIGKESRIVGDIIAHGTIHITSGTEIVGTIRSDDRVFIGPETYIMGDVYGTYIEVENSARIEGTIIPEIGVRLLTPEMKVIESKLERFEKGVSSVDAYLE